MDKREVLRLLATRTLLQLAPTKMFAVLREARALIQNQNSPRTLNGHQYATTKTIAEMIIPRTDTAGATDAGVPDLIDLMLTEWYDEPERTQFLSDLADVDSRSHARFGKDFVDCSSSQQSDILVSLGKDMVRSEKTGQRFPRRRAATPANFYVMFRDLTLTGYSKSEAGAIQPFVRDDPPGFAIHEMGTARMGRDPKPSVLNTFNQAHDVKNLFIADGSAMVSSSCVNPSLTYVALTARACNYAVNQMKKGDL